MGDVAAPQMNVINVANGVPVFVDENQVYLYCKSGTRYFKLYLVPVKQDEFIKEMMAKLAIDAAAANDKDPTEVDEAANGKKTTEVDEAAIGKETSEV